MIKLWGNGIGYGFRTNKEPLWFKDPQQLRTLSEEELEEWKTTYGGTTILTADESYKDGVAWCSYGIDFDKYLVWWSDTSKERIRKIDKIAKELALAYDVIDPCRHGINSRTFYKKLLSKI